MGDKVFFPLICSSNKYFLVYCFCVFEFCTQDEKMNAWATGDQKFGIRDIRTFSYPSPEGRVKIYGLDWGRKKVGGLRDFFEKKGRRIFFN